jgi:hypothetical protein
VCFIGLTPVGVPGRGGARLSSNLPGGVGRDGRRWPVVAGWCVLDCRARQTATRKDKSVGVQMVRIIELLEALRGEAE